MANPAAESGKRKRPTRELRNVRDRLLNHRRGFGVRGTRRGAIVSQTAINRNIPRKAESLIRNWWLKVNTFM
jgi:hypothetical protein